MDESVQTSQPLANVRKISHSKENHLLRHSRAGCRVYLLIPYDFSILAYCNFSGKNLFPYSVFITLVSSLHFNPAAAAAKSLQSYLTLCDPIDGSPSGSSVPGILQARTLEWIVISFSNAWKFKVKGKSLSHVRLLATPRTAAHQASPSMGVSRQEYWSGLPVPPPVPSS